MWAHSGQAGLQERAKGEPQEGEQGKVVARQGRQGAVTKRHTRRGHHMVAVGGAAARAPHWPQVGVGGQRRASVASRVCGARR